MRIARTVAWLALAGLTSLAMAGEIRPFSQRDFDKLTAAGKPVVLDIAASWCPTCKAQKPIIESLMRQPAYKDVTTLTVDFDADKPTLRKYKVTAQSTLVAFKAGKEVGRSIGDTTPEGLEGLIRKTVN